jgi:hypothetical protein
MSVAAAERHQRGGPSLTVDPDGYLVEIEQPA